MSPTIHELEMEVLSRSASDRARLLERLLESFEPDTGVQDAWIAEALRRESEVLSGDAALIPGAEAVAQIRARISSATGFTRLPTPNWVRRPSSTLSTRAATSP